MQETRLGGSELGSRHRYLIGRRLRERRRSLSLTQHEVAARLGELGAATTNKALSSLEHGSTLDAAKLPELARVLECSVTYLLGLTDEPSRWRPDRGVGAVHDPVTAPPAAELAPPVPAGRPWILGPEVPAARSTDASQRPVP